MKAQFLEQLIDPATGDSLSLEVLSAQDDEIVEAVLRSTDSWYPR